MNGLGRVPSLVLSFAFLLFLSGCNALRRNEPPSAAFELSAAEVYPGEEILFDASASYDPDGTIVEYSWDFGDGNKASGEVVTHAYAAPGEYPVKLTVRDDRGATATAEATVTVLAENVEEPSPEPDAVVRVSSEAFPTESNLEEHFVPGAPAFSDPGHGEAAFAPWELDLEAVGTRVGVPISGEQIARLANRCVDKAHRSTERR